jgi:2-iminobutanoate/2-iminopropanoate deaminase
MKIHVKRIFKIADSNENPFPRFAGGSKLMRATITQSFILFLFIMVPSIFAQTDRKHIILDQSPERSASPFSDCVLVGNTLYVSGHVGADPKTGKVPASPKEEARLLMGDLKHTVEGAGLTIDDLVMVQVLCTDLDLFDAFNSVYRTYFHGGFPARAFMGCSKLLFGAHFEVTAIAVKR